MTKDEFDAAIEGTTEQRDIQVRQVENGFVLTAHRRWVHTSTGVSKFGLTSEGVAMDTNLLLMNLESFFRTGKLAATN
jgi:hypothetical protein